MRLLHVHPNGDITLEEFHGEQIPPYAILSHTWGDEEVTFQDFHLPSARGKKGWLKIANCCAQASRDGLSYAWVDTCCIDKKSSAELSEAINSMYGWYRRSKICYAYLSDIPGHILDRTAGGGDQFDVAASDGSRIDSVKFALTKSRWFTRGWTLQELIAPHSLIFYSEEWSEIGQKSAMLRPLANVTGITETVLLGASGPGEVSVAKRMSWASRRTTTRVEDMAYCLLGLFDVNIPLLYGEGVKAFQRLQEEIIRTSDDQSLFAWQGGASERGALSGLLAESPKQFADAGDVVVHSSAFELEPYSMTNKGLRIQLPMRQENDLIYSAALNCSRQGEVYGPIVLSLEHIDNDRFLRAEWAPLKVNDLQTIRGWEPRTIFVKSGQRWNPRRDISNFSLRLRCTPRGHESETTYGPTLRGYRLAATYPPISWEREEGVIVVKETQFHEGVGLLYERHKDNFVVWVSRIVHKERLGSSDRVKCEHRWIAAVAHRDDNESFEHVMKVRKYDLLFTESKLKSCRSPTVSYVATQRKGYQGSSDQHLLFGNSSQKVAIDLKPNSTLLIGSIEGLSIRSIRASSRLKVAV